MVYLLDSWKDFKNSVMYAKFILYQFKDHDDTVEVVVKAGKLGYVKEYRRDDPELREIMDFLERNGILVKDVLPDELIFYKK